MEFKYKYKIHIGSYRTYKKYIDDGMGLMSDEEFLKFYYCFNVLHEIGHAICEEYGSDELNSREAINQFNHELLVNNFAAAFWLKCGEINFIKDIINILEKEIENYNNQEEQLYLSNGEKLVYKCHDWEAFYRSNANTVCGQLTFCKGLSLKYHIISYSHFHNCSIMDSLEKKIILDNVLPLMGVNNSSISINSHTKPLNIEYNNDTVIAIISTVKDIFERHNICMPEIEFEQHNDSFCNHIKKYSK